MIVEIKVETQPKAKAGKGRKPNQPLPYNDSAKPEPAKATLELPVVDILNELAEERLTWSLANGLYRAGHLDWKLTPYHYDKNEAEAEGITEVTLDQLNSNPNLVQNQKDLLTKVERLPHRERIAELVKLSPREWLLYRSCRYGRDLALAQLIRAQPALVPEKLKRIRLLTNLAYAIPIAEIEAEQIRATILASPSASSSPSSEAEAEAKTRSPKRGKSRGGS